MGFCLLCTDPFSHLSVSVVQQIAALLSLVFSGIIDVPGRRQRKTWTFPDDKRRLLGWRLFTELSPKTRWVICVCCCLPLVAATSPFALSWQGLSRPGEQRKQGQTAVDAAETVRIFRSYTLRYHIAKLFYSHASNKNLEFACTLNNSKRRATACKTAK